MKKNSDRFKPKVQSSLSESEHYLKNIKDKVKGAEIEVVKSLIEVMPTGICISSEEGIFEMVNAAYAKLYGYTTEEMIGKHFTLVAPLESKELLKELHDYLMQQEYEVQNEWKLIDKHGTPKAILVNVTYLKNEGKRPQKITFVVDISNIKETEQRGCLNF